MTRIAHPLFALVLLASSACITVAESSSGYDPVRRAPSEASSRAGSGLARANTPAQIAELGAALERRASERVQVGALRVIVEPFDEVRRDGGEHRHAILNERDAVGVVETLQYELTLALGNRLNVVDPGVILGVDASRDELRQRTGATHAVVGTWYRVGNHVDVAARIVSLDDGWIVATAQKRIRDFEGRVFSRALQSPLDERSTLRPAQPVAAELEPEIEIDELEEPSGRADSDTDVDSGTHVAPLVEQLLRANEVSVVVGSPPEVDPDGVPLDFDPDAVLSPESVGPGAARLRDTPEHRSLRSDWPPLDDRSPAGVESASGGSPDTRF